MSLSAVSVACIEPQAKALLSQTLGDACVFSETRPGTKAQPAPGKRQCVLCDPAGLREYQPSLPFEANVIRKLGRYKGTPAVWDLALMRLRAVCDPARVGRLAEAARAAAVVPIRRRARKGRRATPAKAKAGAQGAAEKAQAKAKAKAGAGERTTVKKNQKQSCLRPWPEKWPDMLTIICLQTIGAISLFRLAKAAQAQPCTAALEALNDRFAQQNFKFLQKDSLITHRFWSVMGNQANL